MEVISLRQSDVPKDIASATHSLPDVRVLINTLKPQAALSPSLETQGQSGGSGEKVFKHERKSPWVPTLSRPFQMANFKCSVLLCPMGEQRLLFSFRVFTHDGYCAILVRFFHQGFACKGNVGNSYFALTKNGGTTDHLGRRFRCYQQDRSNLLLDHSVTRYRK